MTALITLADIIAVEPLSPNVDFVAKIRPYVYAAQEHDIIPLIGESFFLEIELNPASFSDLLNETVYIYRGKQYRNPGLKAVIIGYSLSRYKLEAAQAATAYGNVQKETPYSTATDGKLIAKQAALRKSGAEAYWLRVKDYLDRHSTQYPLWKGCADRRTVGGIRISKVSKD